MILAREEANPGNLRPAHESQEIFCLFEGEWELDRVIQGVGVFKGSSVFKLVAPGILRYSEEGELKLETGFQGSACKEYFYQLANDHLVVSFADALPGARPFLRLYPQGDSDQFWAKDVHHCGSDSYECTYAFAGRDAFTTAISVKGAAKNYSMRSRFARRASSVSL